VRFLPFSRRSSNRSIRKENRPSDYRCTVDFSGGVFAQTNDRLVGTWKLVSATASTSGERNEAPYGPNPAGLLTYTSDGRMTVIISSSGQEQLSRGEHSLTPVEDRWPHFVFGESKGIRCACNSVSRAEWLWTLGRVSEIKTREKRKEEEAKRRSNLPTQGRRRRRWLPEPTMNFTRRFHRCYR
jgi:hypothetical protein